MDTPGDATPSCSQPSFLGDGKNHLADAKMDSSATLEGDVSGCGAPIDSEQHPLDPSSDSCP
ncbi:hypothetical protein HDU67_001202, partial [Dinochytrium kinnereticum]